MWGWENKEETCVKRGKGCTRNGSEEMIGIAEKQSKIEGIMLVALWGVVIICVQELVSFQSRSYCCCQCFSKSLITWFHSPAAASLLSLLKPSLTRDISFIFCLRSFSSSGLKGKMGSGNLCWCCC